MRRTTAWLFALILILCLTACKEKSSEKATPGNLATPTPYSPHIAAETTDVSSEYAEKLCSYPWFDTNDWSYYQFSTDGTYQRFGDEELKETVGSGHWQMKKDGKGYLALHMEVDGGEAFDLYDLDLYDESIYAHSLTETSYIWLLCNPKE
jgi:hypothetical protein